MENKVCKTCGKILVENYTFCSKECRLHPPKTNREKVCEFCGKKFISVQRGKRFENQKYCSDKCGHGANPHPTAGIPHSEESKLKQSISMKGKNSKEKSHLWRGGITPLNKLIRTSTKYSEWRLSVFERDGFQCQSCKKIGGYLEAHHIKFFSSIIKENNITTFEAAILCQELWNIDNGITLCSECHEKLPKKVE